MWWTTFQTIFIATAQILLMGAVGYVLIKKAIFDEKGLEILSGMLVKVFMPCLIFDRLTQSFDFQKFPEWWAFPLLSVAVIFVGYGVSGAFLFLHKGCREKNHFRALVSFQNSGYIPLLLVASIFSGEDRERLFVYIFLIIVGFDFAIWSFGTWLLTSHRETHVQWRNLFNPPLVTIVVTLALISVGLHKLLPGFIFKPVKMFGECALPVAMIVAGGNLALTRLKDVRRRSIGLLLLAKLVAMPTLALMAAVLWRLPYLVGFLLVLEAAVPSAVTLSVMCRHFKVDNQFINQGIFWDSVVGVVTIPIFLTLYDSLVGKF